MAYGDPPAYQPPRRSDAGRWMCNVVAVADCGKDAVMQWPYAVDEQGNTVPVFGCADHSA